MNQRKQFWWVVPLLLGWYLLGRPFMNIDAMNHLAIIRSILIDGDISLDNQRLFRFWDRDPHCSPYFLQPTGYVVPDVPLGISVLTLPWGALGTLWARLQVVCGREVPLDGDSLPFVGLYCLGAFAGVLVALGVLLAALRRLFGETPALLAAGGSLLATPLLFYTYHNPVYSHAWSFASGAFFLVYWVRGRFMSEGGKPLVEWSRTRLLGLGGLFGLTCLIRIEAVVGGAALLLTDLVHSRINKPRNGSWKSARLEGIPPLVLGWVTVMSPQFLYWKISYGRWLGPITGLQIRKFSPGLDYWAETFFTPPHGAFLWSPWLLLGVAGIAVGLRRRSSLFLPLAANLLGQAWYYAGIPEIGYSFGYRHICLLLPVVCFGAAALLTELRLKLTVRALAAVCTVYSIALFFIAPGLGWMLQGFGSPPGNLAQWGETWLTEARKALDSGWSSQVIFQRPWAWYAEGLGLVLPVLTAAGVIRLLKSKPAKSATSILLGGLAVLGFNTFFLASGQATEIWREWDLPGFSTTTLKELQFHPYAPLLTRALGRGGYYQGRLRGPILAGGQTFRWRLAQSPSVERLQAVAALVGTWTAGEAAAKISFLDKNERPLATWNLTAGVELGSLLDQGGRLDGRSLARWWDTRQDAFEVLLPVRLVQSRQRVYHCEWKASELFSPVFLEITVGGTPDRGLAWYGIVSQADNPK